ncbi:hypothetical protein BDR06DRAFT_384540 [Suillus hirtellus]|nr:hypothetical protein BDR06DRAFT_384540 [Suillus hirtellus]
MTSIPFCTSFEQPYLRLRYRGFTHSGIFILRRTGKADGYLSLLGNLVVSEGLDPSACNEDKSNREAGQGWHSKMLPRRPLSFTHTLMPTSSFQSCFLEALLCGSYNLGFEVTSFRGSHSYCHGNRSSLRLSFAQVGAANRGRVAPPGLPPKIICLDKANSSSCSSYHFYDRCTSKHKGSPIRFRGACSRRSHCAKGMLMV